MTVSDAVFAYKSDLDNKLIRACIDTAISQKSTSAKASIFNDAGNAKASATGTLNLDVVAFKIPMAEHQLNHSINRPLHPRIYRFSLSHSLTGPATGVLVVTKDHPKNGANTKLSNAHFLEVVTNAGCNHLVSEIMCLSQLRDEYSEHEARQSLSQRIDVVLCDSSLVKVVPRLLGQNFNARKKFPISINMKSPNFLTEVTNKLSMGSHKMTFRNTQSSMAFGRGEQGADKVVANLHSCLEYLSSKFPGGWSNVQSLNVTVGLRTRVPLYVSAGSRNDVEDIILTKESDEIFEDDTGFGRVKMTADGKILEVKKSMNHDDGEPRMKRSTIRRKVLKERKHRRLEKNYAIVEAYKEKYGTDMPIKRKLEREAAGLLEEPKKKAIKKTKTKKPSKIKIHSTVVEDDI